MDDFRYVGATPTDLEGGRPIGPGEFTGPIDVTDEAPKNKMLVEEGLLIPAPNEDARNAAEAKAAAAEEEAARADKAAPAAPTPPAPAEGKGDNSKSGGQS